MKYRKPLSRPQASELGRTTSLRLNTLGHPVAYERLLRQNIRQLFQN